MRQLPPYREINLHQWVPGRSMAWHSHDYLQMILIREGTLDVDWGQGWQTCAAGDLHVLPARHKHRLHSSDGETQLGINFDSRVDERGLLTNIQSIFMSPCLIKVPIPNTLITAIEAGQRDPSTDQHLLISHLLDGFCLDLCQRRQGPQDTTKAELLAFLNAHQRDALSVEDICQALNMSRPTLQRYCQSTFQCGVIHLHERIRIQAAADHLTTTHDSIQTTATQFGYNDIYGFSRAFKRTLALSPRQYRQQFMQG